MKNTPPLLLIDETGDSQQLTKHIHQAIESGVKGLLILACEDTSYASESFEMLLQSLRIPVCGGLFPQVIHGTRHLSAGSIVCGFYQEISVLEVTGLSDEQSDFRGQMSEFAEHTPSNSSLLVFVDGASSRIAYFLEECYGLFGANCQYLGGGTGSSTNRSQPSIVTNSGVKKDCAQLISIPRPMTTSVEHGWNKIAGPFLVTSASNNIIHTLDYRPAFETYQEAIRESTGEEISLENFHHQSHLYPFGMSRIDSAVVVRETFKVKGDSLVCVGEIPENQLVYILYGTTLSLINASKQAATSLTGVGRYDKSFPVLIFDCISRVFFLRKQFQEELTGIDATLTARGHTIGALTMGEIACSGDTCLEFYNKSIVLGVFHEP